jgi:hypothetical protein
MAGSVQCAASQELIMILRGVDPREVSVLGAFINAVEIRM